MRLRLTLTTLMACLFASGMQAALGDTIVLRDGTIVEGIIYGESERYVKIETSSGKKSYRRSQIEKIVKEDATASALRAIETIAAFEALPQIARELKNAEALYALGRFAEIPARVTPLIGKGTKFDDMRIRWMLIEVHEREGEWDEAEDLLERTLSDGREPDKIRATAHLDIFKENPGHTLRKIKGRRTVEFLSRDLRNKGKRADALQDRALMEAALIEYVDQILEHDEVSTTAFQDDLNRNETLDAINAAVEAGARDGVSALPYADHLRKVEQSLYKADAILPGYARGYVLELVRIEADHLREVIQELLTEVSEAYPDRGSRSVDRDTGRFSPEERERWREACDEFIEKSRPVTSLIEYLLVRTRPYPVEMRRVIEEWEDVLERVQQMRQNAYRNRERTRA